MTKPLRVVATADVGVPSTKQALRRLWEGQLILAFPLDHDDWLLRLAGAHLLALQDHPSPTIRRHARKACLRFGLTVPVGVGFNLEPGDSA